MADKKVTYTHEQDLGPGVVRTPGYEVEDPTPVSGISDRRVDKDGVAAEHPILSTYDGPQNGLTARASDSAPAARPAPAQNSGK